MVSSPTITQNSKETGERPKKKKAEGNTPYKNSSRARKHGRDQRNDVEHGKNGATG